MTLRPYPCMLWHTPRAAPTHWSIAVFSTTEMQPINSAQNGIFLARQLAFSGADVFSTRIVSALFGSHERNAKKNNFFSATPLNFWQNSTHSV